MNQHEDLIELKSFKICRPILLLFWFVFLHIEPNYSKSDDVSSEYEKDKICKHNLNNLIHILPKSETIIVKCI